MAGELRPIQPADLAWVAARMRPADLEEVWLASGASGYDALRASVAASSRSLAITWAGEPLALCGVAPLGRGLGIIWLLSSAGVDRVPHAYARLSRRACERLAAGFQLLVNVVWAGYPASLRWVRWLGFEVRPAERLGAGMFHPIWWEA